MVMYNIIMKLTYFNGKRPATITKRGSDLGTNWYDGTGAVAAASHDNEKEVVSGNIYNI